MRTLLGGYDLPCDAPCIVVGELDVERCQFRWLTGSSKWSLRAERFQVFLACAAAHLQRSPDWARCDTVDANALRRQLLRKRLQVAGPSLAVLQTPSCGHLADRHLHAFVELVYGRFVGKATAGHDH
jgi:hypothetical protein